MATTKEFKVSVINGAHGWTAITNTTENGKGWQITTSKGYSGNISSTARKGDFSEGCFSYMMFGGKSLDLLKEKGKATEKAIKEQHAKALVLFDEQTQDEAEEYKIEVGQLICFIGYESNERPEIAIYNIVNGGFGLAYETINTRTKKLNRVDNLRDLTEQFGIGHYYIRDLKFEDLNALNQLVAEAKQTEAEQEQKKQEASNKLKADNLEKFEAGQKIVSIPKGSISVIVAELMQDESDSQSDYYHSSVQKTVYLAFSSHKKDLFSEMRKACLNCDIEEIQRFAVAPEVNNNGETKEEYFNKMLEYFQNRNNTDAEKEATKETNLNWHPEDEHREKYSMGAGFYLGAKHSRSGWRISKETYIDLETSQDLRIATQEERYFCNAEPIQEEKEKPNFEAVEVKAGEVSIVDYSEKSIAVIGDTKPIKEQLKELGGKFNFRLSCGAGWIFQKSKLEEVQNLLSGGDIQEEAEEVETTLKDEVEETINFLADLDVKMYGKVSESVRECARVQEVEIYQDKVEQTQLTFFL